MLDANLKFTDAANITVDGYGATTLDVGPGEYWVECSIVGAATGTLLVTVRGSDSSTFASGVVNLGDFPTFTASGQSYCIKVQSQYRYMRVYYDITTGPFNTVTAGLCSGPQRDDTV